MKRITKARIYSFLTVIAIIGFITGCLLFDAWAPVKLKRVAGITIVVGIGIGLCGLALKGFTIMYDCMLYNKGLDKEDELKKEVDKGKKNKSGLGGAW